MMSIRLPLVLLLALSAAALVAVGARSIEDLKARSAGDAFARAAIQDIVFTPCPACDANLAELPTPPVSEPAPVVKTASAFADSPLPEVPAPPAPQPADSAERLSVPPMHQSPEGIEVIAGEPVATAPVIAPKLPDDLGAGMSAYTAGDYRSARTLLAKYLDKPSAALNYVRAGFQLEEATPQDIELLRKLVDEQHNATAARMLGDAYRAGKYVEADRNQAETYYSQAAAFGDKRSLLRLAQLYDEAGDLAHAIPAYARAVPDFPDKQPRYLYLVAASVEEEPSARAAAALDLDKLAATNLAVARAAFDLYRKHQVPGADDDREITAARTAFALGAHELGVFIASACVQCTVDEIGDYVRGATAFDQVSRVVRALYRLADAGQAGATVAVFDKLTPEQAEVVAATLAKRLTGTSDAAIKLAQVRLQQAGLYAGDLDGRLGRKTAGALKESAAPRKGNRAALNAETLAWLLTHPTGCIAAKPIEGAAPCVP